MIPQKQRILTQDKRGLDCLSVNWTVKTGQNMLASCMSYIQGRGNNFEKCPVIVAIMFIRIGRNWTKL